MILLYDVQIRGLTVDDAIKQVTFSQKKCAPFLRKVLLVAKANAKKHKNVTDPSNLTVAESYVGKGRYSHGMYYKSRGRMGKVDQ